MIILVTINREVQSLVIGITNTSINIIKLMMHYSVQVYGCTIADGYQLENNIKIDINDITVGFYVEGHTDKGLITKDADKLVFAFDNGNLELTASEIIPDVCENNVIEFQSVTPMEAE